MVWSEIAPILSEKITSFHFLFFGLSWDRKLSENKEETSKIKTCFLFQSDK